MIWMGSSTRINYNARVKAASLFAGALALLSLHFAAGQFAQAAGAGLWAGLLLAALALLAAAAGRRALLAAGLPGAGELELTALGLAAGLGAVCTGLMLLGAAHALKPVPIAALLGTLLLFGAGQTEAALRSLGGLRALFVERPGWGAAIGACLAATFWAAWAPPHQYDSLVYHLPLAARYLREGALSPAPHLLFSHFPQNGEMLFVVGLALGSDILAQLFSWLAMAVSAVLTFEWGRRDLGRAGAHLAVFLIVSHAAVMLLSSITYVETIVMLWITAAVLCFLRWEAEPGRGLSWLVLSGVFAGLGVGTKYYAGICPAALAILLLFHRAPRRPALKPIAAFAGAAVLAGSPWLIKNWAMLGNPFFPFLYDRLPHRGIAWGAENARRYFEILTEYGHHSGSFLKDLLEFPYLAAQGSVRFGGGMDVLGDVGWALLLVCAPAMLACGRDKRQRWLLAYCGLHFAAWFSTGVVLRFLTVIVPLLALLASGGIVRAWNAMDQSIEGRLGRGALAFGISLLSAVSIALFLFVHQVFEDPKALLGLESRSEFLSRRLDYYPCARFARERLGKNDRLLLVGEQRGYYVEQDHVTTTPMAPNPFVIWANEARSSQELAARLRGEGRFTHMITVPREGRRLEGYGIFDFTERGRKNWTGLDGRHAKPVFTSPGCAVLALER